MDLGTRGRLAQPHGADDDFDRGPAGAAVHLRSVAGARRAIPRTIHGVRLAITSTAPPTGSAPTWSASAPHGPGVSVAFSGPGNRQGRGPRGATVDVRYPDVRVRLVGTDGNAFAVLGRVRRAMTGTRFRRIT